MRHYYATGSVRGDCGHRHRTVDAAVRCVERDRAACRRIGGGCYSDRDRIVGSDGSTWSEQYREHSDDVPEWIPDTDGGAS